MPRILPSLLAALSLALILPAGAAATDYCVADAACVAAGGADMGSDGNAIQAALDAAKGHANAGGPDRVLVGTGSFSRTIGSGTPGYRYNGDPVTLQGAGAGKTRLTRDVWNSSTVLAANGGATVRDLSITIPGGSGMHGLGLSNGTADGVTITIANGTLNPTGVDLGNGGVFTHGAAKLALGTGVSLSPGATITDSTFGGLFAAQAGGAGAAITISRCRVFAGVNGVLAYYAALTVEDTLVDLGGGGGTAVQSVGNLNGDATAALRHLTIVHGSAAAKGVSIQANGGTTSTATLDDSVIDGVGHPLDLEGDGAGSAVSLTTRYSLASTTGLVKTNTNGAAVPTLTINNAITGPPRFVDAAADWHLRADSPLVDAGTPGALGAGESTTDLDGLPRLVDGRRDVGAFELQPAPPSEPTPPAAGGTTAPDADAIPPADGATPPPLAPGPAPATASRLETLAIKPGGLRPGQRALVTYRLTAPATVRFSVERAARGHRRSGTCRASGHGRPCTRWTRVGGMVEQAGAAGINRLRLPARFGGRKLRPGTYHLVARAGAAKPMKILFRVLR